MISPLLSKETCTSGFRLKILKYYFSIFHCHKAPRYFQWSTWIWMSAIVNNRVKVTELTITCDTYKPHIMLLFDYFLLGLLGLKHNKRKAVIVTKNRFCEQYPLCKFNSWYFLLKLLKSKSKIYAHILCMCYKFAKQQLHILKTVWGFIRTLGEF